MKKNSTSSTTTIHAELMSETATPRPSKMTLDFIKQFARSYHTETRLNNALSGIFVN